MEEHEMADLEALQAAIAQAAERTGPAVVGLGRGWARGSGVVIDPGKVLTCAHALRGEEATVTFEDGRRETAAVAAADPELDLAVLSVDTGEVEPVSWEPGEAPGIGTPVLALANPGGRGLRVTLGFVSSAGRRFRLPRGRRVEGAVEHTAPLPRGSSGGPLVDAAGALIGINAIRLDGGLILALPASADVKRRALALAGGESPQRRRLGVAVAPPRVARRMRRAVGLPEHDGLLVRAVEADGPAAAAGVERGDLIVSAGGHALDGVDSLYAALDELPAAEASLRLALLRGTEEREVDVAFGKRAA
jgi:serine protease Do